MGIAYGESLCCLDLLFPMPNGVAHPTGVVVCDGPLGVGAFEVSTELVNPCSVVAILLRTEGVCVEWKLRAGAYFRV